MTALKLVREDGTPARIEDICGFVDRTTIDIDGVETALVEYRGPDGVSTRARSSMTLTLVWANRRTIDYNAQEFRAGEREWCAFACARMDRRLEAEAERERRENVQRVIGRPTAGFRKFGRRR